MNFQGSCLFRWQIVCSLLSQKEISITNINDEHSIDQPGIRGFEANFLKFIQRISSGTRMEVTQNNTAFKMNPGAIVGGTFSHEVPSARAVGYIVEAALLLLPFAKNDSEITLTGSTHSPHDISVDTIRTVTLRWMQIFGIDATLRIVRRGAAPNGGGCVILRVKACRRLRSVTITERGKMRRVRGIAFSSRTGPDMPQRAATSAKGELLKLLPDVYIVADITEKKKGVDQGSSGYGISLVAESTSKVCIISQETQAESKQSAEEVGKTASALLLEQIIAGGCVDAPHQLFVILLMAMSPDEVSVSRLGPLSPSGVSALSLSEAFFGVSFAVKEEESTYGKEYPPSTIVTCLGCNLINKALRSA